MPVVGEIRRHPTRQYVKQVYLHCPNCGVDRWVNKNDRYMPSHNKPCRCVRTPIVVSNKGAEMYMEYKGVI